MESLLNASGVAVLEDELEELELDELELEELEDEEELDELLDEELEDEELELQEDEDELLDELDAAKNPISKKRNGYSWIFDFGRTGSRLSMNAQRKSPSKLERLES